MLQPADTSGSPAPDVGAPPARRRRRARRWPWVLAIFVVALGAAGAWYGYGAFGEPKISYATVPVDRGDIENNITAAGILQPFEFVDVGAQVSGQLRKIHVAVGDKVTAGQLLGEIDPIVLQTRVEGARAELLALKAQLADRNAQQRLAGQLFERQKRLRADNATSLEAYQSAAAGLASARAQVAVLKAQIQNTESSLKANEANLGYTRIEAPMAGTVVSQAAKQGQTLNANQQAPVVMRVANLSTMTVQTQVSEADIGKLSVGMDVYFTTLGQPNKRWTSKVTQILPTPEVVNNVVLYSALFNVPNPTGELRTQMTAQVFFIVARAEDALTVPVAALKPLARKRRGAGGTSGRTEGAATSSGKRAAGRAARRLRRAERSGATGGKDANGGRRFQVQVLKDDGTVEKRTVRVGVTNRVSAEILSGLEAGEQVVIGSYRDGDRPKRRRRRGARLG
jgi:macrolide-specific efflux system membrane fusion protein